MLFSNTKVLDSAYQSTMYLSTSPRCCLSPQGTDLVCSCWKVSTPLKLAAFVPRRFFKIILLSHSCDQLILPHFECLSSLDFRHRWCSVGFGKGIQNYLLSEKALLVSGQIPKKEPSLVFVLSHGLYQRIFSNKCIARSNGKMSKLHDWPHFQNIAKGTTDPRVEFCLSK